MDKKTKRDKIINEVFSNNFKIKPILTRIQDCPREWEIDWEKERELKSRTSRRMKEMLSNPTPQLS